MITYNPQTGSLSLTADNLDELQELEQQSPAIMKSIAAIRQAGIAAEVLTAKASTNTPNVSGQTSTGPAGIPSCAHGVMNDTIGKKNGKGQPYKFRYYCPADFNDNSRCNPSGRDA